MQSPKSVRPNLDSVTTIREDGSRLYLHPSDARGVFTRWRRFTGWLLIAIYLSLPWIPVRGAPAVFLDIAHRRFHLFGWTLAFQDIWLLFFVITGLGFSLFFITSLLGRVWCGWACPQTVFLEHLYRRVERWIEGDAQARRALDRAPWTSAKVVKRVAKHTSFVLISAAIAHLFIAYFVSIPELWTMMREAPSQNWSLFVFVAVATGILYFNFSWFREQLCIVICPYGRLQSVLIDDNSMVIGYDSARGEPRGKKKVSEQPIGDCVDCTRCVQVCPTGIDIRQGLQIECIGCAACIDACDTVMEKMGRQKGLIRYDSFNGLAGKKTRWLRPRIVIYSIMLLVGASVATWALSGVRPASLAVTRMQGAPYFLDEASVRNQYLVRIVNKRDEATRYTLKVEAPGLDISQTGFNKPVEIAPLAEEVQPLVVQLPKTEYAGNFMVKLSVADEAGSFLIEKTIQFVGPDPRLLKEESAAHESDEKD